MRSNLRLSARRSLFGLGGFVVVCCVWQVAAQIIGALRPEAASFWPTTVDIVRAVGQLALDTAFWDSLATTNLRVVAAILFSVAWAVLISYFSHQNETLRLTISPVVDFVRYIPVAAILPVTIILFGIGDLQKISVLVFGTLFYSTVLITDAFLRVPQAFRELGLVAGLNKKALFWKVVWPGALPDVWQAVRVSAGICWSYILVAEIVAADSGLGFLVIRAQRFLLMDRLFALVLVTGLVGLFYDSIIVLAVRLQCGWSSQDDRR